MYYIGVDVGGTKIAAGIIENNKVKRIVHRPTEASGGAHHVIANIKDAITSLNVRGSAGIGVGIAGFVDHKNGSVLTSPNFSKDFKNVPVARLLKKHFGIPVLIDNDANCFALGEARFGAGKKFKSIVGITLGTGIGGGIIINGDVYRGRHGAAGELGHITVRDGGITCSCGQHGHLEAYASGSVITAHYQAFTRKKLLASEIIKLASRRNEAAGQVIDVARQALAIGFATIINTLNPEIIIIGGGLSKQASFVTPAISAAKKYIVYPLMARTPIVRESLKGNAALLGAAALFN